MTLLQSASRLVFYSLSALLALPGRIDARPMLPMPSGGASYPGSPMMACSPLAPSMPPEFLSRGGSPQARYPSWFNLASSLSGSFGLGGYVQKFEHPGRSGVSNFDPELLGAYGSMPCSPPGGMEPLEAQDRSRSLVTRTPAASSYKRSPPADPSLPRRRPPASFRYGRTDPSNVSGCGWDFYQAGCGG